MVGPVHTCSLSRRHSPCWLLPSPRCLQVTLSCSVRAGHAYVTLVTQAGQGHLLPGIKKILEARPRLHSVHAFTTLEKGSSAGLATGQGLEARVAGRRPLPAGVRSLRMPGQASVLPEPSSARLHLSPHARAAGVRRRRVSRCLRWSTKGGEKHFGEKR
jgi:hypothetical protein